MSCGKLWTTTAAAKASRSTSENAVSILASERESDCLKTGVDLALLYGNGHWPGFDAHLVVQEEIFPVCSPGYMNGRPAIKEPGDLVDEVLLDLRGDRWDWVDWQQWLTEKDVATPEGVQFLSFNNLPLLIQAACRGQGIGLGWRSLVDDLLADQTLIKPIDLSLKTGRGYYVLRRANIRMSPETKTLFDWVIRVSESEG